MSHEVSGARYWEERYRNDSTPWDLKGPCPVFVDLLDSPRAPPRGRTAFPGCGAGHDVRLFRERGYDAIGFDFAFEPRGVPFERLDVFDLGMHHRSEFDLIVEYTCYCAIDPARRAEYASSLAAALKPGGLLLALLFPVAEKEGGPPFAVSDREIPEVLGRELEMLSIESPLTSDPPRFRMERLAFLRRPR
jgi:SAM-dependent methyltransferase